MTNQYEEHQQNRKDYFLAKAEEAEGAANALLKASSERVAGIPLGQPILVGHHSERRHRRDLEKSDALMRKSVESSQKADHYRRKAESVGTGGISSDDPEATKKLTVQLSEKKELHERMKQMNSAYRKYAKDQSSTATQKALASLNENDRLIVTTFQPQYSWENKGPFDLTNSNANIKRLEERIQILAKEQNREVAEDVEGDGFKLVENKEANRIQFVFDDKPAQDVRKLLSSNGFKWSGKNSAWQRQLNANGRYVAKHLMKELQGLLQ